MAKRAVSFCAIPFAWQCLRLYYTLQNGSAASQYGSLAHKLDKQIMRTGFVVSQASVLAASICIRSPNLLPRIYADFAVLLAPSAIGGAPLRLKNTGDSIFNRLWTALHVPAITVAVFKGSSGLP